MDPAAIAGVASNFIGFLRDLPTAGSLPALP
jgi:hypothetical protein